MAAVATEDQFSGVGLTCQCEIHSSEKRAEYGSHPALYFEKVTVEA
jgi:hypothetical protein